MDHLKGHGPKRYSCSLCSTYRAAVPTTVKNHMRSVHHVNSYKMIPMVPARTNPDLDSFIVLPKNSIPKGVRLTATGPKSKDTFSPDQIDSIPRHSVFKVPIRCSVCDFMTKVRQNMVKHLRLHLRHPRNNADFNIPLITPINPPEDSSKVDNFARMTNLLEEDGEIEKIKSSLSEKDLLALPQLVPETQRYFLTNWHKDGFKK